MSPNEVICHGIPDKRPFEDGDIINLDVTVYTREGFHADLNETYLVGDVDADSLRLGVCPAPLPVLPVHLQRWHCLPLHHLPPIHLQL